MTRRRAFLSLSFALALGAPAAAPAAEVTFELRSTAAPAGPAIRIVVEGRRFSPPIDLDHPPAETPASVAFLNRLMRANASGKVEDLLAIFRPSEREATAATAKEPGLLASNAAAYLGFTGSRLLAEIAYGPVLYCVVEHDLNDGRRIVQLYPTVVEDGSWFLTNALKDDSNVETLRQVFADRKIAGPGSPQP